MNNVWMISHDYIDWVENFLVLSLTPEIKQLMTLNVPGQSKSLMTVDRKGIATIPINGPLAPMPHAMMKMFGGTSTSELKKSLLEAQSNSKIKGVLMPVNSPGGNNAMIDETANLIHEISKVKPILAQTMGENGSAAYYLSSNANKIFAQNRTNRIGSIGTRLVIADDSEAMQKAGIKNIVIDTGKNKSIGQSGVKITDEQKEYLGEIVQELNSYFEESVVRGRNNIDINQVNDGSIFLAKNAVKNNLIDGIQPIEKTRARLEAMIF